METFMNSSYPYPQDEPAPSGHAYPLLIKQLLHAPLATRPEQEIVYGDRVRHDYWTFRHRIGQLASGLASIGVGAGDVVAVLDWDSHRYLECYHAIPMMGAVLMTANVRLSPDQLLYTLNHSGARIVLVHRDFLPLLAGMRDRLDTVRHVVLIADGDEAGLPDGFTDEYEALVAAGSPDFAFPDFDEQTRATTFYTTGTTGLPKAVAFTHRQLVLHTLAGMAALSSARDRGRVHRDDVYMPITPMFHVHAWGMPYIATALGLKQVYPGRYSPDGLVALIAREAVTFSHCVPTLLAMILDSPASAAVDLSAWKVIVGGSPLSDGLARAALARGIEVYTGYGMSETCPLMTIAQIDPPRAAGGASADDDIARRTKAGLPLPLVDLRIVDAQFRDVPHDGRSAGEVVVRMPWATQGYLGDAPASAALWAGGYLHTNDIGVIDPDGRLQITDRIKDVIKTGGEWVSSLELESILSRHPAVRESAVIGVKDARWGERPLALVVLTDEQAGRVEPEELKAHLKQVADRGLISRYAVPERLLIVDAIEKTSVGKINKRALRERYQPD
ncbi:long-chain fatty acid--CoA ligase [Burkholderia cenocepacia]|jgi:fatty-acyl-CoA synthase|uniref:Long-chain fatty acid--CoA ligase n=2 Tax=Burkholderia cenocepacia TaxID=95486 RepID=A0A1V2W0J2_9BURK|nr:long-chain fatty acid--CoA ligase [Burkholderia cenocepacia]ONJ21008.1 long-chain fatty acid--CoA ligase [Burkholderia cenocepacia]ONP20920.1 long-chain fatty acid--CoA ligase [Burkholderia cenocepacia]ONP32553.1 long-chain fatty acid--CoA ligase [Burkholderia cenocepacia]ONP46249.1 long-chain fatty acid--CoA ligase [Burkholderia cenocepacia]